MALEDTLQKARDSLNSGLLQNEAQVRTAVISPVLSALGWDRTDPQQWLAEYQVDSGKVDDALFGSGGRPLVFVEAKRHGNLSSDAEAQLFNYAYGEGIPILVLTDGDTWDLYLSMAYGKPSERRFARLSLTESGDLQGVANDMRLFLSRDAVVSDEAIKAAEARLKQVKDREQGRRGLEGAWRALLSEPDEMLRELLIDKVEQDSGARPLERDADEFLRQKLDDTVSTGHPHSSGAKSAPRKAPAKQGSGGKPSQAASMTNADRKTPKGNLKGFVFEGKRYECKSGVQVMHQLAAAFQRRDATFFKKLSNHQFSTHQKFPRALQTGHPALSGTPSGDWYTPIEAYPGWWMHTHLNTKNKIKWMRDMADLAGIDWDRDVELLFG